MWIATNPNGLCNRIKCIISVLCIDAGAKVWWPRNKVASCDFSDLFSNNMSLDEILPNAKVYKHWFFAISEEMIQLDPWQGGPLDFQFAIVEPSSRWAILDAISKLKPQQKLLNRAKEFSDLFPDECVAVQVRSWPEYPPGTPRGDKFDINKYFEVLDTLPGMFFVTSDSEVCVEQLTKRYGKDRIFSTKYSTHFGDRQSAFGDRQSAIGMQDIFVDFLIASKCNHIIGSNKSTFTEMCWWWGGGVAKLDLIDC